MKSYTEHLTMNVPKRMGFVNITPQVEAAVKKSGVQEGLVLCNAMHITASVFINDNESGLHEDYQQWLEELAPFDPSPSAPAPCARRAKPGPTWCGPSPGWARSATASPWTPTFGRPASGT